MPPTSTAISRVRPGVGFLIDIGCVLVFATVGRISHEHGLSVGGVLSTAWPFLVGMFLGWAVVQGSRREWPWSISAGVTVWLATLVIGMLLRYVTGGGVAVTFVVVAGTFLVLTLLGWRVLATRSPHPQSK